MNYEPVELEEASVEGLVHPMEDWDPDGHDDRDRYEATEVSE